MKKPRHPRPSTYSPELIAETKRVFQPHREEPITDADAERMIRNVTGFFEILLEWDAEDRRAEAEAAAAGGDQKGAMKLDS